MTNPIREALEEIVRLSGHDNLLAEQAGPVVFARMGDIHQHASAALSTEWRPDPETVEEAAKIAAAWRISELNNDDLTDGQLNDFLNEIGPNIANAIRSLSDHPSAEKGE